MSMVMFRRALKDLRWTVAWYAFGIFVYEVVILAMYPTISENAALMDQYMKIFPDALKVAFGITDMASLPGFISAEFLSLICPLIVAAFAIMTGAATVAQEVDRGTIELWLSVPEERWRLLTAKLVAILVGIITIVVVMLVGLLLGAAVVGESFAFDGLLAAGVILIAFTIAVGGYAALFSSFANERGRPAGLAAGLTLAFYLVSIIAGLSERWSWVKYLTIFTAYHPQQALTSGVVPFWATLTLLAVGLSCAVGALVIFARRDTIA